MAHDPQLERRLSEALAGQGAKAEPKKMFGGMAFMVRGNMTVGVTSKSQLMVRFAPARHEEVMRWPGATAMTYGKSGMKGFIFVDPAAVPDKRTMDKWVKLALEHAATLPGKAARKTAAKKAAAKAAPKKAIKKK